MGKINITWLVGIITHYGCGNKKRFTVKFVITIQLKIICHVRKAINPSGLTFQGYHLKSW